MVRELSRQTRNAKPTPFHHMLATLAKEGRLLRLYSQNVDCIDTSLEPLTTNVPLNAKGPWPKTIQLHGGLSKMQCTKCQSLWDFNAALFEGPEAPCCQECLTIDTLRTEMQGKRSHGIGRLRPRMVLYNEHNPDEAAIGAVCAADLKARPDAVIVVGTSMKIPGLKRLTKEITWVTRGRKDGFTAWINLDPEPNHVEFAGCWDLVVRAPCDDIAMYANLPRWDDTYVGDYKEINVSEVLATKAKSVVEITLPVHKAVEQTQGMVTPTASPRHQTPTDLKNLPKIQIKLPGTGNKTAADKKTQPKKSKTSKKAAPAKQKNQITNTFAITKSTKDTTAAKPSKKEPDAITTQFQTYDTVNANLFNSQQEQARAALATISPMQILPPTHPRSNSDAATQLHNEQATFSLNLTGENVVRPQSPYKKEDYAAGRRETVSPKSSPRGMAHLLH